ncbi:MAG: SpoIID/LytB domain-containing protein [Planctomycetaceae bacterium]|nr:SpoIID/LytB domain-containing protein [Planctomycetaceae bacterium]
MVLFAYVKRMHSLRQANDRLTKSSFGVLWACVVLMLFFSGCRRRSYDTTIGIEDPRQTWIRVLLFDNLTECTVTSMSGFAVTELAGSRKAQFHTEEPIPVRIHKGQLACGEHEFGSALEIQPYDPFVFDLNGEPYRGYLRLRLSEDATGIEVVNALPIEAYLLGVVGMEMYSYWEPEALKAQSVVSRTYSLYIKNRFGDQRSWDVTATEASQVYRGLKAESSTIRQAVLSTAGQVLTETRPDGRQVVFPTYFSSSCGGHTEEAGHVFGDTTGAQAAVECSYCAKTARRKDFYWQPVRYSMEEISRKLIQRYPSLEKLEQIRDFEVIETGYLSRVTRVQLRGKNERFETLRGEDFRLSLDPTGRRLKSAVFTVQKSGDNVVFGNGRGFGHGVGLCQYGTQELARQGNEYRRILDFYFPDSGLVSIQTSINP